MSEEKPKRTFSDGKTFIGETIYEYDWIDDYGNPIPDYPEDRFDRDHWKTIYRYNHRETEESRERERKHCEEMMEKQRTVPKRTFRLGASTYEYDWADEDGFDVPEAPAAPGNLGYWRIEYERFIRKVEPKDKDTKPVQQDEKQTLVERVEALEKQTEALEKQTERMQTQLEDLLQMVEKLVKMGLE